MPVESIFDVLQRYSSFKAFAVSLAAVILSMVTVSADEFAEVQSYTRTDYLEANDSKSVGQFASSLLSACNHIVNSDS